MAQTTPADNPVIEQKPKEPDAPHKPAVNDVEAAKQGAHSKLQAEVGIKSKDRTPAPHSDDSAESHDLLRNSTPGHDGVVPPPAKANEQARSIDNMSNTGGATRVRSEGSGNVSLDGATMHVKGNDYRVGTDGDGKSQIYMVAKGENGQPEYLPVKKAGDVPKGYQPPEPSQERPRSSNTVEGDRRTDTDQSRRAAADAPAVPAGADAATRRQESDVNAGKRTPDAPSSTPPEPRLQPERRQDEPSRGRHDTEDAGSRDRTRGSQDDTASRRNQTQAEPVKPGNADVTKPQDLTPRAAVADATAKPVDVAKSTPDVSSPGSVVSRPMPAEPVLKPDKLSEGKSPDARGNEVKPAQVNPVAQPAIPASPAAPKEVVPKEVVPKDATGQPPKLDVSTAPSLGQKPEIAANPTSVPAAPKETKEVTGLGPKPDVAASPTPVAAVPKETKEVAGLGPKPDVVSPGQLGQVPKPDAVSPGQPGQKQEMPTSVPRDIGSKENPGQGTKPDASTFNRVGQLDAPSAGNPANFPGRNLDGRNADAMPGKSQDSILPKPDPGSAVAARIGEQQPKDGMPRDTKAIDPGLAAAVNATRLAESSLKPGDVGAKPAPDGKTGDGAVRVGDILAGKTADAAAGKVGEIKLDPSQQMAQQLNRFDEATIARFREMVANFRAQNLNQGDVAGLGRNMMPGDMRTGMLDNKGQLPDNKQGDNRALTPAQLTEAMRNLGINAEMLKAMEANKMLSARDARMLEGVLKAEPLAVRPGLDLKTGPGIGPGGEIGRDMHADLRAQDARLDAIRAMAQKPSGENQAGLTGLAGLRPDMRLDGKEVAKPEITFAPRLDQSGRIEPVIRPGMEPKHETGKPDSARSEMTIRHDVASMNIEAQRQNSIAGRNLDDTTHSGGKDTQNPYDNHRPDRVNGLSPEDEKELLARKLKEAEREKEEEDKAIANARNAMMAAMLANSKKQAEQAEKELQLRNDDAKKKGESQRRRYVVKEKDTLDSIAKKQLRDVRLAALIYEINKHMLPVRMEKGKQVVDPRPGTSIWLPSEVDIREFRGRLYAGGKPSLPNLGGGSKTKMTAEEELTNRFGANWDSNAPTGGVQAGMMEAAVAQSATRRANIEKVLGPISNRAADGGRIRYIVRLNDTLETVAVKHPALKDAMLWPLLAIINNLPIDIDSEGKPLALLKRGMMLDIPLPQEIDEFKQGSFYTGEDQAEEFESESVSATVTAAAPQPVHHAVSENQAEDDFDEFEDDEDAEEDELDEDVYDDDATIVTTPSAPAPSMRGSATVAAGGAHPDERATVPLAPASQNYAEPNSNIQQTPQAVPTPAIQSPQTVPLPAVAQAPVVQQQEVPPPAVPQAQPQNAQPPQAHQAPQAPQAPQFQQVSSARNPVVTNPALSRVQPGTETVPLNPVARGGETPVSEQLSHPQANQIPGNQNPPITSIDSGRDPYATNPLGRPPQISGDRLMWSLDPSVRLVKSAYRWDPTIGVFRSQLELLYNGVWYPVIFFEVFAEAAVRHEYIGMGKRKSVRIDLPPTAAQELADNDLVNNWQAYCSRFVSYLMNPPPGAQ